MKDQNATTHLRLVQITPADAKRFLDNHAEASEGAEFRNRGISGATVKRYVGLLRAGEWRDGISTIVVTKDGIVVDGQHRLKAVLESGISAGFYLNTAGRAEDFVAYDQGKGRTPGDMLSAMGLTSAHSRAATARLVLSYEAHGLAAMLSKKGLIGAQQIVDNVHRLDLDPSMAAGRDAHNALGERPALAAAMHFIFSQVCPAKADRFFQLLSSGVHDHAHDPVWQCREGLRNIAIGKRKHKAGNAEDSKVAYYVKGWNAFSNGQHLKLMRWSEGEEMPSIVGIKVA